jgi:branched-chain amino acid transport system substrate-binding protein
MRFFLVPVLFVLSACQTLNTADHSTDTNDPKLIPSVLDTPVEFTGSRGQNALGDDINEIRIGLFAPRSPEDQVGLSMFRGAELAIEQFNALGGFAGLPIRLVQRWDDDPWRGGSKEMIKLVYEDSVCAVIGSVNGAATHVAEQVVTKAWLPLLSPVSADPTLTYIRIPWMFRLPPDDEEQAAVLIRDGIKANELSNIGLITSTDHDGRIFAEEMREQMSAVSTPPAFSLQVSLPTTDLDAIAQRAMSFEPGGVIVRMPVDEVVALLDKFELHGLRTPVLIPWIPGLQPDDLAGRYGGKILYLSPFSEIDNSAFASFSRAYQTRYGTTPTPSAAYTYDAVNMLVTALNEGGESRLTRAALRDAISDAGGYVGVSGVVSWDNAGGNQAEPVLRILEGRG